MTDRYARFWLAVQERAKQVRPGARIITGAYFPTRLPPIETKLNKDIIVAIVPGLEERPVFYFPWTDARVDRLIESWDKWQATGAQIYLRPKFFHFGHNSPVNYARHYGRYFSHVYGTGLVFTDHDQISSPYATQGLGLYVQARMHRHGDWPVESIVDEYFNGFGPAADPVRAYFDHWEAVTEAPETIEAYFTQQHSSQVQPPIRDNPELRTYRWSELFIPDSAVERGMVLLATAEMAAAGDMVIESRVRFLRMGLENYRLTRAASRAFRERQQGGAIEDFRAALLALDRHRDQIAMHNVANMGSLRWHEFLYAGTRAGIDAEPLIATWEQVPPDTVLGAGRIVLRAAVHLHKSDPDADPPRVRADLSAFGRADEVALTHHGGGDYHLEAEIEVEDISGLREVRILLSQDTKAGVAQQTLVKGVVVVPNRDRLLYDDDGLQDGWSLSTSGAEVAANATAVRYSGQTSASVDPDGEWKVTLLARRPVDTRGYRSLHIAFHPGAARAGDLFLNLNGQRFPDAGGFVATGQIDLEKQAWQILEIPIEGAPSLLLISFNGDLDATFYLDDIRLLAQDFQGTDTVVIEEYAAATPASFGLSQNYPNPFNSETTVRFSLPDPARAKLAVYNLAGQQVVPLIDGPRAAGNYTLLWDGRDSAGSQVATGIYLLRLESGGRVQSRKLLLVR